MLHLELSNISDGFYIPENIMIFYITGTLTIEQEDPHDIQKYMETYTFGDSEKTIDINFILGSYQSTCL